MLRTLYGIGLTLLAFNSYSWNAVGHQLIAQIAYDNLNPKAKSLCNQYNKALNKFSRSGNFVRSATWLDSLRAKDVHWFDPLHYIDIPFSNDGTELPTLAESNALIGIQQAIQAIKSPKTTQAEKGLSLRILVHVIGDVHQPLHTISQITQQYPKGDLGGNLFLLGKNSIGANLHKYWDNGGGILIGQSKSVQIKNKAKQLEKKWSCAMANKLSKPEQWIKASNQIAQHQVYNIAVGSVPSKQYQLTAQNLSQKQIFLAGCRLAGVLNQIVG